MTIPSHRLDFTRGTVTPIPECCDGGAQDRGCEDCPTRPELDALARSLRPSPEARRQLNALGDLDSAPEAPSIEAITEDSR